MRRPYLTSATRRASAQRYREANRERLSAYQRRLRRDDPDRVRGYELRKAHGITLEEYNRLLVAQGGGCAICGNQPKKRVLAVDHDHKSGRVRGLLCHMCNRGLGFFRDKAALFERAVAYLKH